MTITFQTFQQNRLYINAADMPFFIARAMNFTPIASP
jgi:hypothetical protein